LCNLTTLANGSLPTPFSNKKVYSYNPLVLGNVDFEFKRKYIAPFSVNSAANQIKNTKFVMNVTKDMMLDIQSLDKEGNVYDACIILAEWKGFVDQDKELEEFIRFWRNRNMDYYELYTHGEVDLATLSTLVDKLGVRNIIPIDFSNENAIRSVFPTFKVLNPQEELEV